MLRPISVAGGPCLSSFTKSWNSKKMVMESHGKVMEFHFQISVGTLFETKHLQFLLIEHQFFEQKTGISYNKKY